MNGTNVIGGGTVEPQSRGRWKAVGTGDFNGDGHSDILWQNTSNGQAAIWEMNGTNLIGGGTVAPFPGRVGTRSEPATSMATATPTSSGRTITAKPRSGK